MGVVKDDGLGEGDSHLLTCRNPGILTLRLSGGDPDSLGPVTPSALCQWGPA